MGIRMLRKAFEFLKDVSGCYKQVSGCLHLPDPETSGQNAMDEF